MDNNKGFGFWGLPSPTLKRRQEREALLNEADQIRQKYGLPLNPPTTYSYADKDLAQYLGYPGTTQTPASPYIGKPSPYSYADKDLAQYLGYPGTTQTPASPYIGKPSPESAAVNKVVAKNAGNTPTSQAQPGQPPMSQGLPELPTGPRFSQPELGGGMGMPNVEQRINPHDQMFEKMMADYRNLAASIRPAESGYLGDTIDENLSTIQEKKAVEKLLTTIAPMTSFGAQGVSADKAPTEKTTAMMNAMAHMKSADAQAGKAAIERDIFEQGKPYELAKTVASLGTYGYDENGKPKISNNLGEIRTVEMLGRWPDHMKNKSEEEKAMWLKDKRVAWEAEVLEGSGFKNTGKADDKGRIIFMDDKGNKKYLSKE